MGNANGPAGTASPANLALRPSLRELFTLAAAAAPKRPSAWRDERNERALARLERSIPEIFPGNVLVHALRRPLLPPTPRRAIESYWRAHPMLADYLARALAARSGAPDGWQWRPDGHKGSGRAASFRSPPAPYREKAFGLGPGHCCICGQPVFRFGWHADLWADSRVNRKATWHAACVTAWKLWSSPSEHDGLLKKRQKRRCGETGTRLLKSVEVDHRTPLFRVWREHRHAQWPELLAFWGSPNLQVVNRPAHAAKCALEAGERAGRPALRDSMAG
jgi:hypothetical protein